MRRTLRIAAAVGMTAGVACQALVGIGDKDFADHDASVEGDPGGSAGIAATGNRGAGGDGTRDTGGARSAAGGGGGSGLVLENDASYSDGESGRGGANDGGKREAGARGGGGARDCDSAVLGAIDEFPLPSPGAQPLAIALGSDGAVWFTELEAWKIGRATVEDGVTEFDVGARPSDITAGPDGAMWYCVATGSTGQIVRLSPSGERKDFSVPFGPMAITYGPDGNFWLALYQGGIAKLTPEGAVTTYQPEAGTYMALGLTAGPDGNVWFTEQFSTPPLDYVSYVTPSGDVFRHEIPNPPAGVVGIIEGPDHALWFTEYFRGVGRMTTAGALEEFPMPGTYGVVSLAFGPDGNLWATDYFNDHIVRRAPNGSLTFYSLPHSGSGANGIVAGADGAMWFTERLGNRVGRIAVGCQGD